MASLNIIDMMGYDQGIEPMTVGCFELWLLGVLNCGCGVF